MFKWLKHNSVRNTWYTQATKGQFKLPENPNLINWHPNKKIFWGRTVLWWAAFYNDRQAIDAFINAGADINAIAFNESESVIYLITVNQHWDLLTRLIDSNLNIRYLPTKGEDKFKNILWLLAKSNKWDLLERVLTKIFAIRHEAYTMQSLINLSYEYVRGYSLSILSYAINDLNISAAEKLIGMGAEIPAESDPNSLKKFTNLLFENNKQELAFKLIHGARPPEDYIILEVIIEHANKNNVIEQIKKIQCHLSYDNKVQIIFFTARMNDWEYVFSLLLYPRNYIEYDVKLKGLSLLEVAIANNYQAAKKLIDIGANPVHIPNILWLTAFYQHWDLVSDFIAKGVDIHAKPSIEHLDKSILCLAAKYQKLDLIEQLILKGLTIDSKFIEAHATEVLYSTMLNNKWQLAEKLIDANTPLNDDIIKTKHNGETIAWRIAKSKKWSLLQKILSKYKFDLDATPEYGVDHGKTIMWLAAAQYKWDLVNTLIDKGANVNAKATDGYSKGISVLWLVMSYREKPLAEKLIANNAELNVLPMHGLGLSKDKSILMWAIHYNYIEMSKDIVIKLIIQGGLKLLVHNLKNVKPDDIQFINTSFPPQKLSADDFKTIDETILNDINHLPLTLYLLNIFNSSCYTEESTIKDLLGDKPIETNSYNKIRDFANTQKIKIKKIRSKHIKDCSYELIVIGNEIFLHEETVKNNTYYYGENALLKILTIERPKAYIDISVELIRVALIYLTKKDAGYANEILKSILDITAIFGKDKLNKISKVISRALKPEEYLLYAARNNDKILALKLIQEGANPNVKEKFGQHKNKSILWWAVHYEVYHPAHITPHKQHENSLIDALILKNVSIDEKVLIDYGSKLLGIAITNRNFEFAQELIDLGVNVDSYYTHHDCVVTPIANAVASNDLEAAKFLIDNSADVNITLNHPKNEKFTTSLLAFSIMNLQLAHVNCDMIKLLIARGANVNTLFAYNLHNDETLDFISPLALAFLRGNVEAIQLLLNHNAKLGSLPTIILKEIRRNRNLAAIVEQLDNNYDLSWLTLKILFKYEYFSALHDCLNAKHDNDKSYGTQKIISPETSSHDISFAKAELDKVKEYFQKNNITISLENPFTATRDLIIKRIINDAETSPKFKSFLEQNKSLEQFDYDQLAPFINKTKYGKIQNQMIVKDANYQALEWVMSYQTRMVYITDKTYQYAIDLIKEMLSYIITCINELKSNGNPTGKSQAIEDTLIFQLDNAMDAQEDRMSCAPGTPRFLRVVLEAYLHMVNTKHFDTQRHINLQKSVQIVIDCMMRYQFKAMLVNKDISSITTIKKIESGMAKVCEALAEIGTDNAEEIILGAVAEGRYSGSAIDVNLLKLRAHIMYKAFPSLESFHNAVISKMQHNPEMVIILNQTDEEYIKLMYLAISNNKIKEQLYASFNSERTKLRAQHAIIHASTTIANAVSQFRDAPFKNKMKLKNVLEQHIRLLVGEGVNLEASHNVAENIIFNIDAKFDAQEAFDKLKEMYNVEVLRLLMAEQEPVRAIRPTP